MKARIGSAMENFSLTGDEQPYRPAQKAVAIFRYIKIVSDACIATSQLVGRYGGSSPVKHKFSMAQQVVWYVLLLVTEGTESD